MFRSSLLPLVLLIPAASSASAAEIHVPGDYATLQAAIDAASPDDVIVVSGPGSQDPVVVDKPLTILGDPTFNIKVTCLSLGSGPPVHGFHLAGPGSGRVVLGNVTSTTGDCLYPGSSIFGGGFDELHIFNATFIPKPLLSGLAHGSSSILVDVPHVLVEGSEVVGGKSDNDDCYAGTGALYDEVFAAIEAPSSTVTVLDSKIRGAGPANYYCCSFCGRGICPPVLPAGGEGGNGVVASVVFVDAASVVAGGIGSTFVIEPIHLACGKKPDGFPFIAGAVHVLPGDIDGSGATPLGGAFTLSFDVPGPMAVLFFSTTVSSPTLVHGVGYSFLASPVLLGPVSTGAPQSLSFAVPQSAALLGLEGGFQIFDVALGLTAPAVGVLGP
jgi:hypothetical protein